MKVSSRRLFSWFAGILVGALMMIQSSCTAQPASNSSPTAVSQAPAAQAPAAQAPAAQSPIGFTDRSLTLPAELPPLPYAASALEQAIDAQTMQLHHDRHHATYVSNLNEAVAEYPDLQQQSVESLLRNLDSLPEAIRTKVRNNGGGHLNHTIFWYIMGPNGSGQPTGAIAEEINRTFGSFESFKQQFNQAGSDRFGSGWVWLVSNPQGQLEIRTTQNQDNPISEGAYYPLLGNDVWEHAYYLRYQNQRAEYLNNWWNVVNWDEVNRRWESSRQQS